MPLVISSPKLGEEIIHFGGKQAGPHIYTGVGMVLHFYPLFFRGMGVWNFCPRTTFWGGRGVWKGGKGTPYPYPHIIFVTYPTFFYPTLARANKTVG